MTCKECLYYDVCGEYIMTDTDQDVWHYAREGRTDEIPDIENRCVDFKEKSRYIELPCKAGDYVHFKGLETPWKVSAIHFYAEGAPQISITSENGKITTTMTFAEFEAYACVIAEKGATMNKTE